MVLEKTLESPLDCKEIKPLNPRGNQSWIFIARTDVEAETPIVWPPDAKSWVFGKDPDAVKDWRQEGKGMTEDEMAEWHHRLNRHEFEWTLEVGDGRGGLMCCNSWGHKESDTTERLNWTTPWIRESIWESCQILGMSAPIMHSGIGKVTRGQGCRPTRLLVRWTWAVQGLALSQDPVFAWPP